MEAGTLNMRLRRSAFTIIEVVVVIALVMLLLAMLLPMLNKAKQQAERAMCASNLHQIGTAMLAHVNDHEGYLPGPSWYGQRARYKIGSKILTEYLALYLDHPRPSNQWQVNKLFICPSFHRHSPDSTDLASGFGYGAMSEKDQTDGKRVFGYPYFPPSNPVEYGPAKLTAVQEPDKARAVRDIDFPLNGSAGWGDLTSLVPMHGFEGDLAVRNYLYFDAHVELSKEPMN